MAARTQGELIETSGLTGVIQPGSELIYHDSGLIEGTITLRSESEETTKEQWFGALGSAHPRDEDVFLYAFRDRSDVLDMRTATFDCIGTKGGKDTDRIVVPVPSIEMVPIEAHPDFFTSKLAGPEGSITELGAGSGYGEGANGARFTLSPTKKITGFLGFIGALAPAPLRGVRVYQRNTPVLRATWYTCSQPKLDFTSKIVKWPKDAPEIDGIKNWLRSTAVPERVGGVYGKVLWKMVQEYVGSETGWSEEIYGTPISETT